MRRSSARNILFHIIGGTYRRGAIRELHMKRFIGLLVLASVIPATAFAADMPLPALVQRAPLPPSPSEFSWTGWYMGSNAGYFWGSSTNPNIAIDPINAGGFSFAGGDVFPGLSPNGVIGGQIGHDWQVNPQMGGQPRD